MDVNSIIQAVREASMEGLDSFTHSLIQEQLPTNYIETLSDKDKMDVLHACLLVYILMATTIVPQVFQLEAILATLNGHDSIITAGTHRHPAASGTRIGGFCRSFCSEVNKSRVYGLVDISVNEHREVPVIPGPSLRHFPLENRRLGAVLSQKKPKFEFKS
ncbi:hypothetical protein F4604DRAFT_1970649 [Suillus subluteus]|nr:hypothetical protein F4604DRAFT_1970649 [Suillus subluteus]